LKRRVHGGFEPRLGQTFKKVVESRWHRNRESQVLTAVWGLERNQDLVKIDVVHWDLRLVGAAASVKGDLKRDLHRFGRFARDYAGFSWTLSDGLQRSRIVTWHCQ